MYPEYKLSDSPTQKVGTKLFESQVSKGFLPHQHKVRLYSLDNTYSYEELSSWYDKLQKNYSLSSLPELVCELKIDGLAISLNYHNSKFAIGATRGDGFVGENITKNLETIKAIPDSFSEEILFRAAAFREAIRARNNISSAKEFQKTALRRLKRWQNRVR